MQIYLSKSFWSAYLKSQFCWSLNNLYSPLLLTCKKFSYWFYCIYRHWGRVFDLQLCHGILCSDVAELCTSGHVLPEYYFSLGFAGRRRRRWRLLRGWPTVPAKRAVIVSVRRCRGWIFSWWDGNFCFYSFSANFQKFAKVFRQNSKSWCGKVTKKLDMQRHPRQ